MSSATPLTTCLPIIRSKVIYSIWRFSSIRWWILTGDSRVEYSHKNIRTVLHAPYHLQILFSILHLLRLDNKISSKVHEGLRKDYVQNNEVLNFVSGTSL